MTSRPDDGVQVDLALVAAVCDTLLPALTTDAEGAYGDYLRRGASERGIPESVAAALPGMPPHVGGAVRGLLEELAERASPCRSPTAPRACGARATTCPQGASRSSSSRRWSSASCSAPSTKSCATRRGRSSASPARCRRRRRPSRRRRSSRSSGSPATGDAHRRRLRRRLRRGRLGHRCALAQAGRSVVVLEAGRVPQRGGLPPARGGGRRDVPRRRAHVVARRRDGAAGRLDARRRDRDQLDGVPPVPDDVRAAWAAEGLDGSTAPSSTASSRA